MEPPYNRSFCCPIFVWIPRHITYESRGLPVLSSELIRESATSFLLCIWGPWVQILVQRPTTMKIFLQQKLKQPLWTCHMTAPLRHVNIFWRHYSFHFNSGSLQERHFSYFTGKYIFFSCITHSGLIVSNWNKDKVRHILRKYFWTEKTSYNTVV